MGFCLSKCLPDSDMAAELEAELDESNRSYVQQPEAAPATFGATSLLAVRSISSANGGGKRMQADDGY